MQGWEEGEKIPGMYTALARLAVARPRLIAGLGLVALLICIAIGGPAAGKLNAPNAFLAPGSPSYRAQATIERVTGAEAFPGVLALVKAPLSSPEVAAVARTLARTPGVARVNAPSAAHPGGLVARNGRSVVLTVSLASGVSANTEIGVIARALPKSVLLGGGDTALHQVGQQASKDLGVAELIAFPLLFIISLLIFRGIAAALPLAVGGLAITGAFLLLAIVNTQLALSNFALNLVIGVGLGLAVDYSLLLVWRFREELSRGADREAALATTLATAGRTVTFSAVTVAAALLTLALFPQRWGSAARRCR
jgi:RND superfamily putative drug exporter